MWQAAEDSGFVHVEEKEAEGVGLLLSVASWGGEVKRERERADPFFFGPRDRAHGSGSKLHQERFRLDIRRHFFNKREVKPQIRVPREVANTPGTSAFKTHMDNALNNML